MSLSSGARTAFLQDGAPGLLAYADDALWVTLFNDAVELSGNGYQAVQVTVIPDAVAGAIAIVTDFVAIGGNLVFDQVKIFNSDRSEAFYISPISDPTTVLSGTSVRLTTTLALDPVDGPIQAADEFALYVAANGDDNNPGTFESPLLTVVGAQEAVRNIRNSGQWNKPITVYFRGGTYRQTGTIEFEPDDSGTDEYPITYRNYDDEVVIISGGKVVTGSWQVHSGSIMYIDLPTQADFRSLIVGGVPAIRARTPNVGSYYLMEPFSGGEPNESDYFWATPADLPTIGAGETIEVNAFAAWRHTRSFISSIEPSGTPRKVNVTGGPALAANGGFNFRADYGRYFLENSLSFLDQAGEFYWDNTLKRLYYWPRVGETLATNTVEIPALTTLMSFTGSINSMVYPNAYATYSVQFKTDFSSGDATWEKVLVDTLVDAGTPNTGIRISLLKTGGNAGMALIRLGFGVTNYFPVSTAGLNNNAWHTITCVVNTTTDLVTMYVDGVLIGSTAINASIILGTVPPTIGSSCPTNDALFWDGEIKNVVILDKEATLSDAQDLHAGDMTDLTADLLVHFPFVSHFNDIAGGLGSVYSELLYKVTDTTARRHAPGLTGTSAIFNGTDDFVSANSIIFGDTYLVKEPVSNIAFDGIIFRSTDWNLLLTGHYTDESGYNPLEHPGIKLLRAADISFRNCVIANFGGVGILADDSESLTVDASEFDECGHSCIVLNGSPNVIAEDTASGHTITNNEMHDFGRINAGAHGICAISVGDTVFDNNYIHDGSFQAVRFRGRLDSLNYRARDNKVRWNHIHDVVRELNDGAAIYFSGRQPGSEVSYNLIYNVGVTALHMAGDEEMRALYLDEGASGITMSFNVVHDCQSPLLLHKPDNCFVVNNVFVDCEAEADFIRYGDANLFGDGSVLVYAKNNHIYSNLFGAAMSGIATRLALQDGSYLTTIGGIDNEFDFNAYEDDAFTEEIGGTQTTRNIAFMRSTYGIDAKSIAGVDLLIGADYMPRQDSPAFKTGFRSFDLSAVGPA